MKKKSRLLSLIFSIALVLVLSATSVYAEDGETTESTYVAKVVNYKGDETPYSDLSSALAAAGASDTVYLLADLVTTSTISFSHSTTLDLNGCTITYTGSECALKNGLTVTIQNGSVVAASGSEAIRNINGSLTLKNLTVTGGTYAVYNWASTDGNSDTGYKSATVTIESGTYTVDVETNEKAVSAVLNAHGMLVINGGTFTGYTAGVSGYGVGTTVNGGTFIATKPFNSSAKSYSYGLNVSDTNVSISAGTFTGYSMAIYKGTDTVFSKGSYLAEGSAVVSGSPFTWGNGTDAMTCVIDQAVSLGVSTDESATVPGVITSGKGTSTMYVKVYEDKIGAYSTEAYPTTSLTFTDDGDETHNYIFAGWYSNEDGTYTAMTSFPTTDAYAKFVDADCLRVICVYTPASYNENGKAALRFFSSMDSLSCQGFEFVVNGTTYSCSDYYTAHTINNSSMNRRFTSSDICSSANYLMMYRIYVDSLENSYNAYASWTTGDGTKVTGTTLAFNVDSSMTGSTVLE